MCVNVEVTLPVLALFLTYYTLRTGCIVTLLLTSLRNFFILLFFVVIFMEIAVDIHNPMAALVLDIEKPPVPSTDEDYVQKYVIFFTYEPTIIAEAFLFIFLIHLLYGIMYDAPHHLEYYLLCRFIIWVTEVLILIILCLRHDVLINWYLFFLIINIMEVYLFMTVYSHYVNVLIETEKKKCNYLKNIPCSPPGSLKCGL